MRKQNSEELNNFHEVTIALGCEPAVLSFPNLAIKHHGNDQMLLMRHKAEGLGSCTHLWVEWELHMGSLSEAELGEVIENCQEMVILCQWVFIADA